MKKRMAVLCACFLSLCMGICAFSGCESPDVSGSQDQNGTEDNASGPSNSVGSDDVAADSGDSVSGETAQEMSFGTDGDMFTDRDSRTDYEASGSVTIQLNGSSAEASSDSVQISGSVITITEEATYIISGTLDDGRIVVDAPDTAKLWLVFNGVSINCAMSAPLYILEADKVFVTLAEGTENTLSNGGGFTAVDENNIDGVIFSKQDLTLNGSGSLTITSPAGHGIVAKDDLVITGGAYAITSASHGLQANDSVRITGEVTLAIDAGKDGIHAENDEDTSLGFVYISGGSFDIAAEGDGISAGAWMQISDGTVQILAGGGSENGTKEASDSWGGFMGGGEPGQRGGGMPGSGNMGGGRSDAAALASLDAESGDGSTEEPSDSSTSMKGLKAAGDLLLSGGAFTIDSADDAVHSNSSITVSGGTFAAESGDDAFHADDTLTVTGGTIDIAECYEGLEALHVDIQGGEIRLVAGDDGLNAAGGTDSSGTEGGRDGMFGGPGGMSSSSDGTIVISGGTICIQASGDGLDANGTIEISGGYIVVEGPTQGDTSTLDYDVSAVITGGTFIGTGASGMAQTFSDSEQGVIAVTVGTQSSGTEITLTDQEGNVLFSHTPELDYNVVILSSPDLVSGETYTLTAGTASGETEAE